MKKILAFAGSNSSTSINHALIENIASRISNEQVNIIRLDDFPLAVFSEDLERDEGYSPMLQSLLQVIKEADGYIISVNEHNGAVSAFFKNVMDWLSRIEYKFLAEKKSFFLVHHLGKEVGFRHMNIPKEYFPGMAEKWWKASTFLLLTKIFQ